MVETSTAAGTATIYDESIVCPVTRAPLLSAGDRLVTADGARAYAIVDGIPALFVDENTTTSEGGGVTAKVQEFYTAAPFPNYNTFDDVLGFVTQARENLFARMLGEQIPLGADVLEVGCGTGQLSNYLGAVCMAKIYAADMTLASLRLGQEFARKNHIAGVTFMQMNLFAPSVRPASMDVVISNGVLHHTADTRRAFLSIAPLVKPGGHIVVGLYNRIGRLRTDLRRHLYGMFGEAALALDPHLRRHLSPEKRKAWIQDQYLHPQELKHSMDEVLDWFREAGFSFVSSVPKMRGDFGEQDRLFEQQDAGNAIDRFYAQAGMLFSTHGGEGGLFVMIGRKM